MRIHIFVKVVYWNKRLSMDVLPVLYIPTSKPIQVRVYLLVFHWLVEMQAIFGGMESKASKNDNDDDDEKKETFSRQMELHMPYIRAQQIINIEHTNKIQWQKYEIYIYYNEGKRKLGTIKNVF